MLATTIGVGTLGHPPSAHAASGYSLNFGVSALSRSDIAKHEAVLGRQLDGVRLYRSWDSALFGSDQKWARDHGNELFLSIRSARSGGGIIRWHDISAAKPGSQLYRDMQRQAAEIKTFGATVNLIFNHEPDAAAATSMGSPAEFVAAWRALVGVYRASGVTNAHYTWTVTAWGLNRTDSRSAQAFYPGDSWVDIIASDAYNWSSCRKSDGEWQSLAQVIEGHRKFGLAHPSKTLALAEWASVEDYSQSGRKASWIADAASLFKKSAYRQFESVLWWNGEYNKKMGNCHFNYNTTSSATAAWVSMGNSFSSQGLSSGKSPSASASPATTGTPTASASSGPGNPTPGALDGKTSNLPVDAQPAAGHLGATRRVSGAALAGVLTVASLSFGAVWLYMSRRRRSLGIGEK
jgi:hypothetical protein